MSYYDTVVPLLAALNVYNNIAPPYTSCVFVELWNGPSLPEPYVRVLYRNDTSMMPKAPLLLRIPGMGRKIRLPLPPLLLLESL